ncbi:MAG: HEPN domain-containing protein [Fibromonadaceae bacterium]|jgi:HEPN domain-containing protein|nr:HEPN domain-containing protein [Fibromonadaceae bacterium]
MKSETKNWLYFANNDIHMISDNINTEDPEATGAIAVFCQQAVEKYLKAYLIEHSVDFPKTHDLLNLYNKAKAIKDWHIDEIILASLNGLYIKTRYPSDIAEMPGGNMPTLEETKEFIDFAKNIASIVKAECEY